VRRFPYSLQAQFAADPAGAIGEFNRAIIESTADLVCAYKPNLGFYLAYGLAGLEALARTRAAIPAGIPAIQMRHDLMPLQIEVDPSIRTAPFGAAQHPAIESARGGKIMDRKGEMEGLKRHAGLIAATLPCVIPPSHSPR
jgi:hypothetical protein